jgi:hypothetical protein
LLAISAVGIVTEQQKRDWKPTRKLKNKTKKKKKKISSQFDEPPALFDGVMKICISERNYGLDFFWFLNLCVLWRNQQKKNVNFLDKRK